MTTGEGSTDGKRVYPAESAPDAPNLFKATRGSCGST